MMKPKKTNMKLKFTVITINSVIFSSLLVTFTTFIVIKSFELEDAFQLFPVLFIGLPLLASGIVSIIFTIIATEKSHKELHNFMVAIDKVAEGDFSVKLDESKTKALRLLYSSFNRMVRELNSVQILRNDFISSFSHEFKTPIVSIRGFAKLAKLPETTPEERNEYLDIIITEINRLVSLSNSTLSLTYLESKELVIEKEIFQLDEQIRESIVLLQDKWESKNIDFNLELENIKYNGNKDLLQQLWINIIDNAIKFSHNSGTISILLKDFDEKNIQVSIIDEGIGMDNETIKQIFNKFYQFDSSRQLKGIGLGLSISKRIVDLCDGKISVISENDKGSTFKILLPKDIIN